jgi:hypothetical protein
LAHATIVKIPNSLSQLSVLRYEFGSAGDATAYFDALRAQVALVSNEQCTPAGLGSGVPSAVSLFAFAGSPQADATGTTAYPSGPYAGGFQYNVARYLEQGRDVYIIRVDREYAYADIALEDAVQNAMTTRTASASSIGGAASPGGYIEGVLRQGTFGCCTIKTPPVGPIGLWAESQDMNCPELVANGTVYSINIQTQLPDLQPAGFVTASGSTGLATTIPWGARVRVVGAAVATSGIFGCLEGNQGDSAPFVHGMSVVASP